RADLFQRSYPNDDLLHEKRIPPRKIARNGVSCRISGIDEELPVGMFDEKAKDRDGSHPLGIAKDSTRLWTRGFPSSIFRSNADRPSRPHCWARFNCAVRV